MKKILVLLVSVSLLFTGCDILSGDKDKDKGFDYKSFSNLIKSPGSPSEFIDSDVEFVGMVLTDRVEEDGKEYIVAGISRSEDVFYVDVTDVKEEFAIYDVVTIKGKVADVYFSSIVDNKEIAHTIVIAESLKEKKTDDSKASTDKCQNIDGTVEYSFTGASYGNDVFGDKVFAVYYNAKGLEGTVSTRLVGVYVLQGEEVLDVTVVEPDNVRGDVLSSNTSNVEKDDEKEVYSTYKAATDSNDITIEGYDDEFNLTCQINLTAK